jgi:hypothetical protein
VCLAGAAMRWKWACMKREAAFRASTTCLRVKEKRVLGGILELVSGQSFVFFWHPLQNQRLHR